MEVDEEGRTHKRKAERVAMDEGIGVLKEEIWAEGRKLKNGLTWVVKVNVFVAARNMGLRSYPRLYTRWASFDCGPTTFLEGEFVLAHF